MVILLLLSLLTCSWASELSCAGHFPIKESVDIVRKLVEKYAIPVVRKDDNGVEWMNNLIVKNQGLEVDGTRYFLNDNRLPPEMTFYFDDSLLLHAVPLFVVGEDQLDTWRPDFPDKTYALTKISHQCAVGQRACGLKCCYSESDKIQKSFIELSQGGNLSNTTTYSYNDITYSLEITDNSSTPKCSYDLSYHDVLFRRARVDGKPISTIHFSCPERFSCCGLTCLPSADSALLRKPRKAEMFSFKLDQRRKNILLEKQEKVCLQGFIELSQGGNLSNTTTYSYNDVTYSLEITDNSSTPKCSYDLSYHDLLFRRAKIDGKHISTIYFSCPERFSCCGLTCLPSADSALLRKPRKAEMFSFKLDQRRKNILLVGGALLALTAFVGITFVNYRWAFSSLKSMQVLKRIPKAVPPVISLSKPIRHCSVIALSCTLRPPEMIPYFEVTWHSSSRAETPNKPINPLLKSP
ncbi:CX module [Ancylostoma caninum]|uniref:CX module n=1 Tax=Ancylostoma caninum TaxID=29170 RepID=A0A368GG74_ANCCA|nr:CX module [Ancylostoma caninum]